MRTPLFVLLQSNFLLPKVLKNFLPVVQNKTEERLHLHHRVPRDLGHPVGKIGSLHVLPRPDLISDYLRKRDFGLDCPADVGDLLQARPVDYFLEIGGYLGDCSLLAGVWGFARKGVFSVDADGGAIAALKRTVRGIRAEFGGGGGDGGGGTGGGAVQGRWGGAGSDELRRRSGGETGSALATGASFSHAYLGSDNYLFQAEAAFVSDKNGFFKAKRKSDHTGPNAFRDSEWVECEEEVRRSESCTRFLSVDKYLEDQFPQEEVPQQSLPQDSPQDSPQESPQESPQDSPEKNAPETALDSADDSVVDESTTPPSTAHSLHLPGPLAVRIKVSGDEDVIVQSGMRRVLKNKNLAWVHVFATEWCVQKRFLERYDRAILASAQAARARGETEFAVPGRTDYGETSGQSPCVLAIVEALRAGGMAVEVIEGNAMPFHIWTGVVVVGRRPPVQI